MRLAFDNQYEQYGDHTYHANNQHDDEQDPYIGVNKGQPIENFGEKVVAWETRVFIRKVFRYLYTHFMAFVGVVKPDIDTIGLIALPLVDSLDMGYVAENIGFIEFFQSRGVDAAYLKRTGSELFLIYKVGSQFLPGVYFEFPGKDFRDEDLVSLGPWQPGRQGG